MLGRRQDLRSDGGPALVGRSRENPVRPTLLFATVACVVGIALPAAGRRAGAEGVLGKFRPRSRFDRRLRSQTLLRNWKHNVFDVTLSIKFN
jgi:hypothetical protein